MNQPAGDPHNVDLDARLTRLAYLGVGILVVLLAGIPLLLVGILALSLDRVAWPAVAGLVAIALALALGLIAYRRLLGIQREVEAPRWLRKVFISYRTAEHAPYAQLLVDVLTDSGIDTFFLKSGEANVDPDEPFTYFTFWRALGFFQAGGLDAEIQGKLLESAAMVYFMPLARREVGYWQFWKDTLDEVAFRLLVVGQGFSVSYWRFFLYGFCYRRPILPADRTFSRESWQAWELDTARQLDLPVLMVAVDGDASRPDEESIRCGPATLESDYRTKIVPRLKDATRAQLRVEGPLLKTALAIVIMAALGALTVFVIILTLLALAAYLMVRAPR